MSIDLRMLAGDEVVALVRKMQTVAPLLRKVPPRRLMEELGWPEVPGDSKYALFCDPGLGLGEASKASVTLAPDGSAKTLAAPVHAELPRPITEEIRDFRQDAFSVAGRALIADLGTPTDLMPGGSPRLKWRTGDSAVTMARDPLGVRVLLWRAIDLEAGA